MSRARIILAVVLLALASSALAQVTGTLDGYAPVSLSGDEATVTSAANVTYTVNPYFNCRDFNATLCTFALWGTHTIQPGFKTSFAAVADYDGTIQGPATPQTCYSGAVDATLWLKTDVFIPLPVGNGSWVSDQNLREDMRLVDAVVCKRRPRAANAPCRGVFPPSAGSGSSSHFA